MEHSAQRRSNGSLQQRNFTIKCVGFVTLKHQIFDHCKEAIVGKVTFENDDTPCCIALEKDKILYEEFKNFIKLDCFPLSVKKMQYLGSLDKVQADLMQYCFKKDNETRIMLLVYKYGSNISKKDAKRLQAPTVEENRARAGTETAQNNLVRFLKAKYQRWYVRKPNAHNHLIQHVGFLGMEGLEI